jgi:hypothetical protein
VEIDNIIRLLKKTVEATHKIPAFTTARREITKILVNTKLICNVILG